MTATRLARRVIARLGAQHRRDYNTGWAARSDTETAGGRMTLKRYDASMLDQLALELFDLVAILREMANRSREFEVDDLALHDKKAKEWYENMERWVRKAQAELEMRIIEARATRRAFSSSE
ncbi:MAG: hypothetical protein ACYTG0_09855 [Planctomycetota bacterium]|jgi:hypothetical protein